MSFAAGTIFISYSRSDGRDFAETFERRLQAEGIHAWRDLKNMAAGDIRPQVLRAIEDSTQLVLILSRRALKSEWIKSEWSHARLKGKRVNPALADPTLTRADRTARIWDAATGAEIARMTLDAAVTALAIHQTAIALGDALGRIHVFDAEDFLG